MALFATTIGAISGFGGGVIIKPVLDALSGYNAFVIGVLSSCTVLTMAVVSVVKSIRKGFSVDAQLILITAGALVGGLLGKELFENIFLLFSEAQIMHIQSATLIVLLIFVLFKNKLPMYNIKSTVITVLSGLILGTISSFLGIGGGPFNIVLLTLLFGLEIKKAVIASIFIILFSQISNLTSIALTTGFMGYDFSALFFMLPAAVVGGFVGTEIGGRISDKTIDRIYYIVTIGLIFLNLYNFLSV